MRSLIVRCGVVMGLVLGLVALSPTAGGQVVQAAVAGSSQYVPVGPVRLVDTREDKGFTRTAATTLHVPVAGISGVPKNAVAVSLSVAVTNTTNNGFVTVWPGNEAMPLASNVNFERGQIVSNGLIVKLGTGGGLSIFSSVGVDIVVDVTGAFVPAASAKAGRFVAADPVRLLDSRAGAPMGAGGLIRVALPSTTPRDAVAAAVTLTTSGENEPGFFTAFGAGSVPWSSSLNIDTRDSTRAATVVVPVSGGGISVFSSSGGHMIVDFLGYFTGASAAQSEDGLFVPMTPKRLIDTRTTEALVPTESIVFPATGGVVVGNLAMTEAAKPGFSVVYAAATPVPGTSSVNAMRTGQTVSNMAISRISTAGLSVYSQQGAQYVVDQTGYFTGAPVAQTTPLPTKPLPPAPPAPPAQTDPDQSQAGCSVTSLLVPTCGAWFGASTVSKAGLRTSEGYATGLNEYEQIVGNVPDILHFYKSGAQVFPNSAEIAMSQRSGKQRSLLFYNWKPNPGMSWSQIANGGADSEIATVANGLKKYNHKIFLTIWHEPENDVGGAGRTPAEYAAMFRYTVNKLRSHGVTNAVFVINYMGFFGWADMFDELYPGNDVVDWIAYDPYGAAGHDDFGMFLDTKKQGFEGFYTWATNKAPGKPIMLAEWGFDLPATPNAPAILDGAVPIIQNRFPALKALVYWHDDLGNFKVRLDQSTAIGQAYAAAYSRLAKNAYFNATPTAAAP